MKLVCPGCGAVASAEVWSNDADCRETLAVITRLPSPLPPATISYIALFRPGTRALSWKKALRLVREIEQLAALGYVSVQGRIDRNCAPAMWARAMEQMVEQRHGLSLPMPNHNYLKKVAYDLAEQADYSKEKKVFSAPAGRKSSSNTGAGPARLTTILDPMNAYIQGLRDDEPTREEMQAWARRGLE